MTSSPRLIVFDCDGTLVDSQGSIIACMTEAFMAIGVATPMASDVRAVVGLPLETACARVLAACGGDPTAGPAAAEAYRTAFRRRRAAAAVEEPLFPGMGEAVRRLDAAGALLAVATGKSRRGLDLTLSGHGLSRFFLATQTADDAAGKPAPDMLLNLSRRLGVDPKAMVMVGDTSFDMAMAVAAGATALGVDWGYHPAADLRAAGARHVAEDTASMIAWLEAWLGG